MVGHLPEGTRGAGRLDRFHHGAAYLALVTGAPVVPVTMIGTPAAGGVGSNALPATREPIDLVLGEAWRTGHSSRGRARGNTSAADVGVVAGTHAVRAGRRPLADAAILAGPFLRDNPRTTPTPGSSSTPESCEHA